MTIYLDATIILDLVDFASSRGDHMRTSVLSMSHGTIVTSDLIFTESLVRALRAGQSLDPFEKVLARFPKRPVDEAVCRRAAAIRATTVLKTPDALHLAAAVVHACDELWTSDAKLLRLGTFEGVLIREP